MDFKAPKSRQTATLLIAWTAIIITSIGWNSYQNYKEMYEKARIEARTIFEHNIAYRKWNAMHGGVYAAVSEKNRPNEYLIVPDRDIIDKNGRKFTMINPFRMTKQAYDLLKKESPLPTINRTVSLAPLNPENTPDEWEIKSLMEFEKGKTEVSEVTNIDGDPYMRILKPYITAETCLKCHGFQGYKIGDIRGGMSIAVPLWPYYSSAHTTNYIIVLSHLLIWLFGGIGIVMFNRHREKQQIRIAESEWKFRTLSEFSQDWEYWLSEDREIAYMSPSVKRITGYEADKFTRKPALLSEIIHPDDRDIYKDHFEQFSTQEHQEMIMRIITKDGDVRWLSHICGPIMTRDRFMGRRVSNRDITKNKKIEEHFMQSQKMESIGQLAGGIAHDFNNLLTVIRGYAAMLQEELSDSDSEAGKYAQNIIDSSDMAQNLTSRLLVFSRKQITRTSAVNLNETIRKVSELVRRIIGEDIELNIVLADPELYVMADQSQLEQALLNLVTNARDAMLDGGALSIQTKSIALEPDMTKPYHLPPGQYILITVSDTGSGIDPKNIPHIFEPFFTTKEKERGTGLGLSMVYEIVKQHGGFINVYSERGTGTTFRIYLPALSETEQEQKIGKTAAENETLDGSGTILLTEDEESVQTFIKDILEKYGYTVISASDGEEALEMFARNRDRIDMVILDVILPKKNGKDVYNEIIRTTPNLKALFISGYTQDILTSKGIYEEGLHYIGKPINITSLLLKIREILSG